MWDRTGLHRPRPGAKEGLWTKAGGPRAFPRDPRRDGDGGDAASRLLPRFHRALPSAQGGRQPCAYPPPIRVRAFSGAGDPACCLRGGRVASEGSPVLESGATRRLESTRWPRTGGRTGRRTLRGRLFGGRRGMGLLGPSPLTRGKPRLQKLDALAGRSSQSGWRCLMPTHLALLKPKPECLAAGFDGLKSPSPGPVGNPVSSASGEPAL